jgi:hypothetical protein
MALLTQRHVDSAGQPGGPASFDYESVPASVATFLKGQADRIRRSSAKCVIQVGKDLIAAKHYLSHGSFGRWVQTEIGIPVRTAQAYMRVAQWTSKRAAFAYLPPSVLYLLSASNTPDAFTRDILDRLEAGATITIPELKAELKALRRARREPQQEGFGAKHDFAQNQASRPAAKIHPDVLAAVKIIARGLAVEDFARVRDVMTSKAVLDDPEFAQNIRAAFSCVEHLIARPNWQKSHAA